MPSSLDDLLAVLPTGHGKSLIFQLFAFAASLVMEEQQTVLVVLPSQKHN